ncbi:MAG: phospholipid carrier-dependent glycosyltransferase [Clostridiales bacterium]|nr:phospholipid carrier-dependent glycosyltransferase [Clostridiales bacterium]
MKRKMLALLCVLLACFTAVAENLVLNPGFELEPGESEPQCWYTDAWKRSSSIFEPLEEDGGNVLHIFSFESNDARWVQDISVEPNTVYQISCLVKAATDGSGRGANISILNSGATSSSVYDTEGEWQEVRLNGKTGKDQYEISLALRLGGYGGDCAGEAWFKDISVVKSGGSGAVSFATFEPSSYTNEDTDVDELPERQTEKWTLYACLCAAVMIYLYNSVKRRPAGSDGTGMIKGCAWFCVLLILGLFVRGYYAFTVRGYSTDINCFAYWGELFYERGFRFYATDGFCDYPPVYMALLGLVSALRRLLGLEYLSAGHIALIKLFPILSDAATAWLVYSLFSKRRGWGRGLLIAAAVLFNPAYLADSAAWGQADSLLALLICLTVYLAVSDRWFAALPVFALAAMTKPQALLFGPIGLVFMLPGLRDGKKRIKAGTGLLCALLIMYLGSLPFALHSAEYAGETSTLFTPVSWLFGQLMGATGGYRHMTVNACNLYQIFGFNWMELSQSGGWETFSWIMLGASYLYAAYLAWAGKSVKHLPLAGAVLMCLIYAFAPMMHERYLFCALPLLLIGYVYSRDRRVLWSFMLFTCTQMLNIILVLQWGTTPGFEVYGHLVGSEHALNAILGAANVLGALFIAYTAFDVIVLKHVKTLEPEGEPATRQYVLKPTVRVLRLTRTDCIIMAAVTVAYSFLAFINLGTTSSPQSAYVSEKYKEQVTFDLGEIKTYRFTYFGGISGSTFTVALSNDAEHWTEENYAYYEEGAMYRWLWYAPKSHEGGTFADAIASNRREDTGDGGARVTYKSGEFDPLQTSRYLRITVMGSKLVLNEAAFIDVDNETLYPVVSLTGSTDNPTAQALIDEQDTVKLIPSYYNGMYFDEIYHARTAFELINGCRSDEILEWSHPHLGKLIIALGIKLFGMTPFGWRFSGALFGVMMLPLMYLLVKLLTKKTPLAAVASLLLALDSLHFTQTRIATIDTYPVFFIMLMYLFMFMYYRMNMHADRLWKTLIPLGLSGVMFGFACASKWTGIYAGAGLAVIFFMSVGKRINEYLIFRKDSPQQVRYFWWKLAFTLAFCVVFFIIVPLLIYYFSYYWHFRTSGGLSVAKVWELQQQMYGYHTNLVDTHFFRSPWYEWPLIVKPMWYYSSDIQYLGYGTVSSISAMGNPAVWWTGLVALIVCILILAFDKKRNEAVMLTVIGFMSQFLPWVLVPRSTYIYHYFASVIFIIICIALVLGRLVKLSRITAKITGLTLLVAAAVLFIMFYPLESGLPCAYSYALNLRWFNWYNFEPQYYGGW